MELAVRVIEERNKHIEDTVQKQSGRLSRFIRRFVTSNDDADDILQDVFYQFVIGYDQIRSWDQVSSWLFRVARNKITDSQRKKKPVNFSALAKVDEDGEPMMLADLIPDTSSMPDRELFADVVWARIEEILATLPENQRQVFVWHEFEQKSFNEMAEITGEPVNTLTSRKRYAILALRTGLVDLFDELIND